MISPRYSQASKSMVSFINNGITYNIPSLFIPLNQKDLYKYLWDETENAKMIFYPNKTIATNVVTINGFEAC
jgi:hypothetical protein